MSQIFTYITHKDGIAGDVIQELLQGAKKIDQNLDPIAIVVGYGSKLDEVCNKVATYYKKVWKFNDPILEYPNAEIIRKLLINNLPKKSVLLLQHSTFGMDLAPGLSIKLNYSYAPDVTSIEKVRKNFIEIIRQEFGGMVSVRNDCDNSNGSILTLRSGCFQTEEDSPPKCNGEIVDYSNKIGNITSSRKFIKVIEAEAGDVDITKSDILVSIGRGIEDEDNIEIAQELANSIGAVVSCSRPIVDSKWLNKSRQVGTSGQTVKPKVYIACGISGSFQHIGGLKGSPFIIAINKNIKAPIFQIADIGVEADILEFLPELTKTIKNL